MKMNTETFVLEAFGGKGKFTKETNVALLKYYNSAL